jgi:hypothetical protein
MNRTASFFFFLFLVLTALTVFSGRACAQLSVLHGFRRDTRIPLLSGNGDSLLFPFAGGMNSCQFMNIDLNLDGTPDLLVFDRHGNRFLPFVAGQNPGSALRWAPELCASLPAAEQWVQAADYDGDGRQDLFTYTTGGIKVFRNESSGSLAFRQMTFPFLLSQQGSTLTNILVTYADYPAIADVDHDGDLDVLTFWGLGSFVEWHRNTSVERFGNADSLTFEKASSCWGHFAEGNESNLIRLDTCLAGDQSLTRTVENDPKHTGSTLLVCDPDGNGLPDLVLGDVDYSSLVYLQNGGTVEDAHMVSQTTAFPGPENPVSVNLFPAAMLADADNDGRKDLLVSPFDPSLTRGENAASVRFYKNSGTDQLPVYSFVSDHYMQDQMLDVGSGAYPVFADLNADGLQDLLIGNYGFYDTCIYSPETGMQCFYTARLTMLLNTGTAQQPVFRIADQDVAGLSVLQMQSLIPALADMDGDGDPDLVCGNSKGKFVYCENTAGAGNPAEFVLHDPAWFSLDAGDFSAPQLLDIDGDGDFDLISGRRNGTLSLYRNTGTSAQATFTLETEFLGGVDVTDPLLSNYGYSTPCFYRDGRDSLFLFCGSEYGNIFVYDQISGNTGGTFRLKGVLPGIQEGWRTGIAIGNLNADTLADLAVGNYAGGIGLFTGNTDPVFGWEEHGIQRNRGLIITPNPASGRVQVSLADGIRHSRVSVEFYSTDGHLLKRIPETDLPFTTNLSDLKSGLYLIRVSTSSGDYSAKLMICH